MSSWSSLREHVRRALDPEVHEPLLPRVPNGWWIAKKILPAEVIARIEAMTIDDRGHGYDAFGMSRDGLAALVALSWFLHQRWFRVQSHGIEHIPREGPAILAANHSGTLPWDALMIGVDVIAGAPHPRPLRPILEWFIRELPIVGRTFVRAGGVGGSRANLHALLDQGELVLLFPEGIHGIGKPFSQRYQLQRWTEGHVELAIRHGVPVVPVAVVGAEEAMPQLGRVEFIKAFGAPWLPIPATLIPFPVRCHIWYGAPIHFAVPPEAADDPAIVDAAALHVRHAVGALLEHGLAARQGFFS